MRGLLLLLVAGALLAASAAWACPICFSGRGVALGQKIDAADAVVLAVAVADAGPYRVVATITGDARDGFLILDANPPPAALLRPGRPLLAVRNRSSQQWSVLGSILAERAAWLRDFAATSPRPGRVAATAWPRTVESTADLSDEDWQVRLALVAPDLENDDPLVAEIAYGELARAPYRLMRFLAGARDPAEVSAWLDDGEKAARRPAYTLLLGIVGGEAAAAAIEAQIDTLRAAKSKDNLAALIAADLEIRGPARLAFVEHAYLSDVTRTLPELEAALLALSVHGTANQTIPRDAVVSAYREFVETHPAMAGFVVPDLTAWGAYEPAGTIGAALASGAIRDPASQAQVLTYLQRGTGQPVTQQGIGGDLPP